MPKMSQTVARSSLAKKLSILLFLIFASSLAVLLILVNILLENQAVARIDQRSNLIMDTMIAVRQYTSKHINPIIEPINNNNVEFLPEAVPSYSASTVFSLLKEGKSYASYSYREATLNPTNLKDKADSLEAEIIQEFRSNPTKEMITGERKTPIGSFHYIARPLKVSSQSCLVCHSKPDLAPKSQILTYGKTNGFDWKLGETIGSQIVTVPVSEIYMSKWMSLVSLISLIALSFLTVGLATIFFLQKLILNPIRLMSAQADQASTQPESIEFSEKLRTDEIGTIARSFERMKQSLVISIRLLGENNK
jgi:HAMP domain-containing protein